MTHVFDHTFTAKASSDTRTVVAQPSVINRGGLYVRLAPDRDSFDYMSAHLSAEDTIALRDSLLTLHPLPEPVDADAKAEATPEAASSTPETSVGDRVLVTEAAAYDLGDGVAATVVQTFPVGSCQAGRILVETDEPVDGFATQIYADEWQPLGEIPLAAWEKALVGAEEAPEAPAPSWAPGDRVLIGEGDCCAPGVTGTYVGDSGNYAKVEIDERVSVFEAGSPLLIVRDALESLDERETPDFEGLCAPGSALDAYPIGTRVRVLRDEAWGAEVEEGEFATVTAHTATADSYFGAYLRAALEDGGEEWYFRPGIDVEHAPKPEPEPEPTFEVGDVVEITGGSAYLGYWATAGAYGTVVEVEYAPESYYGGVDGDGYIYTVRSGRPEKGDIRQTLRHGAANLKPRGFAVGDRVMVDYCRADGTDYLAFLSWSGPATVTSAIGYSVSVTPDHRPDSGGFSKEHVSLLDETPGVPFRKGDVVVFDPKEDPKGRYLAKRGATATVTENYREGDRYLRVEWHRDALSGSQRDGGYSPQGFRRIAPAAK